MPQPLSSKDRALFQQVVRNYETKQFKKGLKAAEQILKKNPNHGDTQAMKALLMSSQGQQEEAFALAKVALKNDMKSHVCWHVYGLLYRTDKNYEEAIKAYKFALRLEPDSKPIQRDLAFLQMQMRDYAGYIQSRKAMLQQQPSIRSNWTALAIAHHLSGDLTEAENVLTTFEDTLKVKPTRADMENSEALLYKNRIIAESGEIQKALNHLEASTKQIGDVQAMMELKADYLLQLGKHEEAIAAYTVLLERNAENSNYYQGLIKAKQIKEDDKDALKALYAEWLEKNPKGDLPRREPLEFLQGEEFKAAADAYLRRMLSRGVPSLFANIKNLYIDSAKLATVQELVEEYVKNPEASANGSADKATDGPSRFHTFALYFLAQHYNYYMSRDLAKSMEYINKAIELDSKSVDFHMTKARIWKHRGNLQQAADAMEAARALDKADRYINTKTAKYQLRNNENDKALDTMSKFTRNDINGGPLGDLHEMQCIWFITEDGEAYLRQRKLGLALKRFHSAFNIFETWQEDQFDFHNFSLRKGMIRAYVDLIRWEDHLRDHPYYIRLGLGGARAYILLHDEPDLTHGPIPVANGSANGEPMSEADRKKALKKAKKEQQRLEKEEAEKREAKKISAAGKSVDGEVKKEDTDPLGNKLLQTETPLEEATKFLQPLLDLCPGNIEVQNLGLELFIRKKKYSLALKCLLAAHAIDPSNPTLHMQTFRFRSALTSDIESLPPAIKETLVEEFKALPASNGDPAAINESFAKENADKSLGHVVAAVAVKQSFNKEGSEQESAKTLKERVSRPEVGIEEALAGLKLIDDFGVKGEVRKEYVAGAKERWTEATVFQ